MTKPSDLRKKGFSPVLPGPTCLASFVVLNVAWARKILK